MALYTKKILATIWVLLFMKLTFDGFTNFKTNSLNLYCANSMFNCPVQCQSVTMQSAGYVNGLRPSCSFSAPILATSSTVNGGIAMNTASSPPSIKYIGYSNVVSLNGNVTGAWGTYSNLLSVIQPLTTKRVLYSSSTTRVNLICYFSRGQSNYARANTYFKSFMH